MRLCLSIVVCDYESLHLGLIDILHVARLDLLTVSVMFNIYDIP